MNFTDEYPVEVKFIPIQQIKVRYMNKYLGMMEDVIVAGSDAVKYYLCESTMYEGGFISENCTKCKFVGEYTKPCFLESVWMLIRIL